MTCKMILIPAFILLLAFGPCSTESLMMDKLLIAAKDLAPAIVTEIALFGEQVFQLFQQYYRDHNMGEDLLPQRFVDVTMELYEDLQKKCHMEKVPLNKAIEDLDDDIRMLYIALRGMIVGLIIATSFFFFATRRLHRKVARERKAYHDLLATIKASRKFDDEAV
ncbi:hypothetical protein RvY_02330 [Ramazzottius varieornatus]|uniref:Uncharacterized protein n=1 Tax=Ramazzottius varieornatus TaxID=947166 RepID=A0A1D1UJE3_RAMVA|nr:hypothetical protein RvY_02330 [Ramazzottius varieornatus]